MATCYKKHALNYATPGRRVPVSQVGRRTLCQMFCLSFGASQRLLFKRVYVQHAVQCSERRDWHVLSLVES